jgi:hypothetical protein
LGFCIFSATNDRTAGAFSGCSYSLRSPQIMDFVRPPAQGE